MGFAWLSIVGTTDILTTSSDRTAPDLGRVIASRARDIEERWLARVSAMIAARTDVELTNLRDAIPDYLGELGRLLKGQSSDRRADGTAAWIDVARHHGIARVRSGFDIDQLVSEFVALRKMIEDVAAEEGVVGASSEIALADLIDAAIAQSVRAYVEQRDYEARRVQAENIGFLIHELRNPLTAAMQAEAVLRGVAGAQHPNAIGILERSLHRLNGLIDGVLQTERLEAGRVEPHYARISVRDLIASASAVARETAHAKDLTFEVRGDLDEMIDVDPELTGSTIANLIENAVKYTDIGGVEVTVDTNDETWTLHVRDSCPGLSREELRTIFEPFRRGSTSKAGTGLGLAIARRAIEAQGGRVQAESPGPIGCHFWITAPRSPSTEKRS